MSIGQGRQPRQGDHEGLCWRMTQRLNCAWRSLDARAPARDAPTISGGLAGAFVYSRRIPCGCPGSLRRRARAERLWLTGAPICPCHEELLTLDIIIRVVTEVRCGIRTDGKPTGRRRRH